MDSAFVSDTKGHRFDSGMDLLATLFDCPFSFPRHRQIFCGRTLLGLFTSARHQVPRVLLVSRIHGVGRAIDRARRLCVRRVHCGGRHKFWYERMRFRRFVRCRAFADEITASVPFPASVPAVCVSARSLQGKPPSSSSAGRFWASSMASISSKCPRASCTRI